MKCFRSVQIPAERLLILLRHSFCPSVRPSVCLSVRTGKLKNGWTDFHKVWYWGVLLKFVGAFQFCLTSISNNGHFILIPTCVSTISVWLVGESPGYLSYHCTLINMVTMVTLGKGQMWNSCERARIVNSLRTSLLGAFVVFWTPIKIVLSSACLPVYTQVTTWERLNGFVWHFISENFSKKIYFYLDRTIVAIALLGRFSWCMPILIFKY
jgi:hypothetical protein